MGTMLLDAAELRRRQGEVDAWARWRVAGGMDLFDPETAPSIGAMAEYLEPHYEDIENPAVLGAIEHACEETVARRRGQLVKRGVVERSPLGRWILFSPGFVDYSKLAYEPGFVDVSDAPGWDVWVALVGRRGAGAEEMPHCFRRESVLAWIPDVLVDKMNLAVACSPLGSLEWLDQERNFHTCTRGDLVGLGLLQD
jgi:hypothetical protein